MMSAPISLIYAPEKIPLIQEVVRIQSSPHRLYLLLPDTIMFLRVVPDTQSTRKAIKRNGAIIESIKSSEIKWNGLLVTVSWWFLNEHINYTGTKWRKAEWDRKSNNSIIHWVQLTTFERGIRDEVISSIWTDISSTVIIDHQTQSVVVLSSCSHHLPSCSQGPNVMDTLHIT